MPTTLSPVGICNIALSKIGALSINSLTDTTNSSALACNTNFNLCYLEVSRSARWNCILDIAILVSEPQIPLPGGTVPSNVPTWEPLTSYLADSFLTYGGYFYLVLFDYTSTNNFVNDLTAGALAQTNLPTSNPLIPSDGSQYPSGWSYKFRLPADFQLLVALNDNTASNVWRNYGETTADYEIIGESIYCEDVQAVIQYVKDQPDPTRLDSLFVNALTLKLASTISTSLRQDGGRLEQALIAEYKSALREARTKNAGERQPRRFSIVNSSKFNASRYGGVNG